MAKDTKYPYATPVACPHWSPGRITMRTGCTACAADAEPSNTDEREALTQPSYWHQPTYEFLHRDAADAIEALESENDRLRIDNLGHVLGHSDAMLRTRLERAEQERDRLRVQSDILWQGLNEAKTHIEKLETENSYLRGEREHGRGNLT